VRSTRPDRTPTRRARRTRRRAREDGGVRRRRILTGLAALLNSVRFNQIPSNAARLEMKVIASVVVGAPRSRGRGTVLGTVLGVVLLGRSVRR